MENLPPYPRGSARWKTFWGLTESSRGSGTYRCIMRIQQLPTRYNGEKSANLLHHFTVLHHIGLLIQALFLHSGFCFFGGEHLQLGGMRSLCCVVVSQRWWGCLHRGKSVRKPELFPLQYSGIFIQNVYEKQALVLSTCMSRPSSHRWA